MNITYVGNYVGKVSLNPDGLKFIEDVRKALKGSGFYLLRRGGNPDRKQFSGSTMPTLGGGQYRISHSALRAALPVKFASYVRLYVRVGKGRQTMSESHAVKLVESIREIYYRTDTKMMEGVPNV
jgi:hypothetical protein